MRMELIPQIVKHTAPPSGYPAIYTYHTDTVIMVDKLLVTFSPFYDTNAVSNRKPKPKCLTPKYFIVKKHLEFNIII